MSRPGLIVGLGGTGQWVLTWLKRDLQLANNGRLPANVRLLSIDTTSQLEADTRAVAAGPDEEEVKVGDVRLTEEEFIYLGGDALQLTQQISRGQRPNIGKWYKARRWLDSLGPAGFSLDEGAGRIRQFGRVAVFKDVLGRETGSELWRALHNAIQGVRRAANQDRRLEIIVVGSFAGGTGSGMFLDIALILRMLAQRLGVPHVLRGYFALPSVFTTAPEADMLARTFAAWRELNRFMVVNSDFQMPRIEYVEGHDSFRIDPDQRIFDACYLVDSKRAGTPISAEAKYGVHPMVAEVISAILDDYAGMVYTQHIFQNLSPEYARTPDQPLYSAVGSYTVQVPAHYKQEAATLDFTRQTIRTILKPRDLTLAATGAGRLISLAAPDQNHEVGVLVAGRTRSLELLSTAAITYGGETAKPTPFTGRIADIVDKAVDQGQRATLVHQLAVAGAADARKGGTSAGWLGYFTNLGDDPKFEQLRRNVKEEVNYRLLDQYQQRKGESTDEARARFTKISSDVQAHYGGETSTGEVVHGSFGARLREAQDFHLALFRRLVRLRMMDILNGRSDQDPVRAKSGKLGYAWDYFDGLVDNFERFQGVMDEVKQRREELRPEVRLQGLATNARTAMERNRGKTLFWVLEAPSVRQSQDAYLQAQQRVIDLRKEDLLHHYVVETARGMKEICAEARDILAAWIFHLSTGDDPRGIEGLWTGTERSLRRLNENHSFDTSISAVQGLVAEQVPPVDPQAVAEALRFWEWVADFPEGSSQLRLGVEIQPEATGGLALTLEDPTVASSPQLRRRVAAENQYNLTQLGRRRFAGAAASTRVADAIKSQYPDNPAGFATRVGAGVEPLFDGAVGASPRRKSNLIRVQAPEHDSFFYGPNGLEGELRGAQKLDRTRTDDLYNIRVVSSENGYKLTLVRTDDLYSPEEFRAWEECLTAYAQHLQRQGANPTLDPVLMQNFAAEAHAVGFERTFVAEGETFRPLHPRVVMLLEEPRALRQFLYLLMFNMVRENNAKGAYRWELSWNKKNRQETFWLTRGWNSTTDADDRPQPDLMNAIHGYVIMGRTWQPERQDRIDYEFADRFIGEKRRELGLRKEREMLQYHLASGLVAWLRGKALDPDVEDRVLHQDLFDLAKVAEVLLREQLEKLEAPADDGFGRGPVGGFDPFARTEEEAQVQEESALPPANPFGRRGMSTVSTDDSRLEPVLANRTALQQFVYLGMFGFLQEQGDRRGYRWELIWTKGDYDEVFWLTEPWNERLDHGHRRPDLLDALSNYVMVGKTLQPGREEPIDYDYAAQVIEEERERLGAAEEAQMLEDNLGDEGFVGWLRQQAYDPDVKDRVVRPEFETVAHEVEKLLEERLDELKRRRKVGSSPFKVRRLASGSQEGQSGSNPRPPAQSQSDSEPVLPRLDLGGNRAQEGSDVPSDRPDDGDETISALPWGDQ